MVDSKIISIIPARAGSKRVPNKNITDIHGQPLIAYTILDSLRCKYIDRTIVSTNSEIIGGIAKRYGAEFPFVRPDEYSTDTSTDLDWAKHFLDWYYKENKEYPRYIVHLRPTTPLRCPMVIAQAIFALDLDKEATCLRSVEALTEPPEKTYYVGKYLEPVIKNDNPDFQNLPSQSFRTSYKANGYVDILKAETILNGSMHGTKILPFITQPTIEIDTPEELELLKIKLSNY